MMFDVSKVLTFYSKKKLRYIYRNITALFK